MKRYTEKHYDENGYYLICSGNCETLNCGDCGILDKIVDRLAAYEDTGLEPEDFKRAFNEAAVLKLAGQALGITPDRLRELAQADREGRCVVFPCRIGDTVFAAETNPIITLNVTHFGMWLDGEDGGDWESIENIGKTIFLTHEEAAAALRREQDG